MKQAIEVKGMVLSNFPIGENDKRITLLTKELGKVHVFARGARKQGSLFMGGTSPFVFGDYSISMGRSAYNLHSLKIGNYFSALREKEKLAYYGFYFLEIADYYSMEGADCTEMLKLLYVTISALTKEIVPLPLIQRIYELRTIGINGEAPLIEGMGIQGAVLQSLQHILYSPFEKLYSFTVSIEVWEQIRDIIDGYWKRTVNTSFKSQQILMELYGDEDGINS